MKTREHHGATDARHPPHFSFIPLGQHQGAAPWQLRQLGCTMVHPYVRVGACPGNTFGADHTMENRVGAWPQNIRDDHRKNCIKYLHTPAEIRIFVVSENGCIRSLAAHLLTHYYSII
jgi:hypothetical protein